MYRKKVTVKLKNSPLMAWFRGTVAEAVQAAQQGRIPLVVHIAGLWHGIAVALHLW